MNLHWTPEEYLKALKHQRKLIADGKEFEFWDDDTIGNKDMRCSWGCSPREIPKSISNKPYRDHNQWCPLDLRLPEQLTVNGCFWTCRVFNGHECSVTSKDRDFVLQLYDEAIERAEKC